MPELPEVETVRRGLEPVLAGARLERVILHRPDLRFPFPEGLAERLAGRRITALSRRAKYLIMHVEDGEAILSHLGMSGSWRVEHGEDRAAPGAFHHERSKSSAHDHVVFELTPGTGGRARLVYNDPRRFGFLLLVSEGELGEHPLLAHLGIEPTGNELSGAYLAERFAGKRAPLKLALMDQRIIAGLGNIYVCEALWRAGLSPDRPAGTIGDRADSLADAIRVVIAEAIEAGGSSLRDFIHADGTLGYFQHGFRVYDREGAPCPRCHGTIARSIHSNRSTFHCPRCQE